MFGPRISDEEVENLARLQLGSGPALLDILAIRVKRMGRNRWALQARVENAQNMVGTMTGTALMQHGEWAIEWTDVPGSWQPKGTTTTRRDQSSGSSPAPSTAHAYGGIAEAEKLGWKFSDRGTADTLLRAGLSLGEVAGAMGNGGPQY